MKKKQKGVRGNSPSALKVVVGDKHIETGIRCDAARCMTAEAIKESAGAIGWIINRVRVDINTIRFTDVLAWKRYIFFTPAHVRAAIMLFEQGMKPVAFAFVLRRANAAQVIDCTVARNYPSKVARRQRRQIEVRTRKDNRKRRSVQGVTVKGGKALPLMPRQTTRMFGQCGMSPHLFRLAAGLQQEKKQQQTVGGKTPW